MKKVFLIILSYGDHKDTFELLESLKKVEKNGFELYVVIVDNYPPDPIRIDAKEFKNLNLHLIYSKKNLGFSGGNNMGINYSLENKADYLVIQNNDTLVDMNYLNEMINVAGNDNSIGVVVPKIYFAKGYEFHKDKYRGEDLGKIIWYAGGYMDWQNVIGKHKGVDELDKGQFDDKEETEIATGCCLLIKKEVVDKVCGYDDKYFLYYEDADLSQRVKKEGYSIFYAPRAKVWHKNAQSTGGSGSELQDYFITRNRLLFGMKYAKSRAKIALFRESVRFLVNGRTWQKKGVLDFYLRKFGQGSYPV